MSILIRFLDNTINMSKTFTCNLKKIQYLCNYHFNYENINQNILLFHTLITITNFNVKPPNWCEFLSICGHIDQLYPNGEFKTLTDRYFTIQQLLWLRLDNEITEDQCQIQLDNRYNNLLKLLADDIERDILFQKQPKVDNILTRMAQNFIGSYIPIHK